MQLERDTMAHVPGVLELAAGYYHPPSAAYALEQTFLEPDNASDVRRVLDELYRGITECRAATTY
jgi:hypothetical protein